MSDITSSKRKRRVQILKRLIVVFILAAILIPTAASVYLGLRVEAAQMEAAVEEMQEKAVREAEPAILTEEDGIRAWEEQAEETAEKPAVQSDIRKVYLTFDDGPSIYTDDILDILKEYDVKATFFVVGEGKEPYEDACRRIVEEGHTLGMHSYSHVYQEIYASREDFIWDVNVLQDYLHQRGSTPTSIVSPAAAATRWARWICRI